MSRPLTLHIPDMSCGHCSAAVTSALKDLDAAAEIKVDQTQRRVTVTTAVPQEAVIAGLDGIGFEAHPAG